MASPATKRRSIRQAASRKRARSIYVDPETDDDFESLSGEEDGEADFVLGPDSGPSPPKKRKLGGPRRRPHTRSKSKTQAKSKPRKKVKLDAIAKPRKQRGESARQKADAARFKGPSDGVIPAWTSLPAAILREIFIVASQPLTSKNVSWLNGAARTCRAFAEPALEALYHSPAFWSPLHPHRLLELLRKREGRYMNYNTKVKEIEIDVRRLAYTAYSRPLFDLSELVAEVPQLRRLEIVHPVDEPPYRDMKIQGWTYPGNLFQTLESRQIRLDTWRWNRSMLKDKAPDDVCSFMASIHECKAFEHLRALVVCGFNLNDSPGAMVSGDDGEETTLDLAWAISKLKNLKDITFISCDVVREGFLDRLPQRLERLELSNCHEVNSDVLARFLIGSGSQLREMVLDHNPALGLAFLPGLKANCPRLEELGMDLHYYSELSVVNDAEPLFDELLAADEVPAWPATMQVIDLVHLQKLNAAGAKNLFGSLVASAADLPDLRCIVLHSHINIPWRDRAGFRDHWIDRLQRVYKREWTPPNPHLGSKLQYKMWKASQARLTTAGDRAVDDDDAAVAGRACRRVSHMQISPPKSSFRADDYADARPSRSPPPKRRSQRVAAGHASIASAASTASSPSRSAAKDDSDSGSATDDSDDEAAALEEENAIRFVRGLCHVVDIRIDNQRPRENQFTEQDFLDTEASGDEDWEESADVDVDDGYAW